MSSAGASDAGSSPRRTRAIRKFIGLTTRKNTTAAIVTNVMTACRNAPYRKWALLMEKRRSTSPDSPANIEISGETKAATKTWTSCVNAVPITIATASSTTLPRSAKSRNSFRISGSRDTAGYPRADAGRRGLAMTVVRCMRGGVPESEHRVAWCVVQDDGVAAEAWPGAADLVTYARSAVKPFQALPSVRAGVLERFGLDDRHLALACASHGGSDQHVAGGAEMLAACGLDEHALGCGPPRHVGVVAEMRGAGGLDEPALGWAPPPPRAPDAAAPATRIRHNCSGKHALGLARCRQEGWSLAAYLEAEHPLQDAMRAEVA